MEAKQNETRRIFRETANQWLNNININFYDISSNSCNFSNMDMDIKKVKLMKKGLTLEEAEEEINKQKTLTNYQHTQ